MADLKTSYLGFALKNPLVASASPLSENVETVQQLEEAGIAAVVMYSLFEEQITHETLQLDHHLDYGTESFPEALTYLPQHGRYSVGPEKYLQHLSKLKEAVDIPIIGSLNGVSKGKWIEYAKRIQDAGADALELNLYNVPTDPGLSGSELEYMYINLVENIRTAIEIPLAVKLSPFFSAIPHMAKRLVDAGADGLVLFNRFYQPDYDLEALEVVPNLVLSSSEELRLPLRWIAILYGQVEADLALTSGVHTAVDVLKAMMAGAKTAMVASAILKHGISRVNEILANLENWMSEHEYTSIEQMQGSMSQQALGDADAYKRANYMKVLSSYSFMP